MWLDLNNGDDINTDSYKFEELLNSIFDRFATQKIIEKVNFNEEEFEEELEKEFEKELEFYVDKDKAWDYTLENYPSEDDTTIQYVCDEIDKIIELAKNGLIKRAERVAQSIKSQMMDTWHVYELSSTHKAALKKHAK